MQRCLTHAKNSMRNASILTSTLAELQPRPVVALLAVQCSLPCAAFFAAMRRGGGGIALKKAKRHFCSHSHGPAVWSQRAGACGDACTSCWRETARRGPRRRRPGGPGHERDGRGRLGRRRAPVDGVVPGMALRARLRRGRVISGYSCGSGVLAIAAWKLGCREAVGVDVEYEALESAAENAERNGADGVDWVHGRSVVPGMDEYDAVVANILVTCTPSRRLICDRSSARSARPSMVATLALGTKGRRRAVPRRASARASGRGSRRLYAATTTPASAAARARRRRSPVDVRADDVERGQLGVLGLLGEASC